MELQNLEILGGLLLANIKLRGVLVLAPRVTAPSRAERAVPVGVHCCHGAHWCHMTDPCRGCV